MNNPTPRLLDVAPLWWRLVRFTPIVGMLFSGAQIPNRWCRREPALLPLPTYPRFTYTTATGGDALCTPNGGGLPEHGQMMNDSLEISCNESSHPSLS